jgi:hypothetical protein
MGKRVYKESKSEDKLPKGTWLTNFAVADQVRVLKEHHRCSVPVNIGDPKETERYTVERLKKLGMMGLYVN